MKAASDVALNNVIQMFKTLLNGKSASSHNHDGVYSYGSLRTYNSGTLAAGTDSHRVEREKLADTEKFYIVLIGSTKNEEACATVCIDWQMLPAPAEGLSFGYTIVRGGTVENGTLWINRNTTTTDDVITAHSVVLICESTSQGHYIKQVCGYK